MTTAPIDRKSNPAQREIKPGSKTSAPGGATLSNIVPSQLLARATCAPATGGCDLAVQIHSDGERF